MFATSAAVLALAVAVTYAQDLSIQTPPLAQCANSVINYSGGTGPYYVAILQGQNPCDNDAIQEFYNVYGNSVSYTPALNSGTPVIVYVEDANGHEAWSDVITLGNGDSSCLGTPAPYTPPAGDSHTYTPSTYTPTDDSTTDNSTTDNSTTDNNTTDNDTTDNSTPGNDADSSSQSSSDSSSQSSSDSSSSSPSATPESATSSTYVAPYNPAPSPDTDSSSVSVQSTNNNSNDSNQDTTPANANSKAGGATGLAVSAFTTLSALLVVSFGLF